MNPSSPSGVSRQDAPKPKVAYYCMECPETFIDAASSNAHYDATGHGQTWRPSMAFHAPSPQPDQKVGATRQPASSSSETATEADYPFDVEIATLKAAARAVCMRCRDGETRVDAPSEVTATYHYAAGTHFGKTCAAAPIWALVRDAELALAASPTLTPAEAPELDRAILSEAARYLDAGGSTYKIGGVASRTEMAAACRRAAAVPAEAPNEDSPDIIGAAAVRDGPTLAEVGELVARMDKALLEVCGDNAAWNVGTPDEDIGRYVVMNENGDPIIDTNDPAEAIQELGAAWGRLSEQYEAKCRELAAARSTPTEATHG